MDGSSYFSLPKVVLLNRRPRATIFIKNIGHDLGDVLWYYGLRLMKKEGSFLLKSNEPIAHVSEDGRVHSLMEHLEGTAKLAAQFAAEFGWGEWGRLARMWQGGQFK